MVMEQYLSELTAQNDYSHNEIPLKFKSIFKAGAADKGGEEDINPSESMDCSICLELVQDPVVTFCGHLYCWPCIYKWIRLQSEPSPDSDEQPLPQCPVCKAEISEDTVIPLYGKGVAATEPSNKGKAPHLGLDIPQRPQSPRCESPRSLVSTPTAAAFVSRVPQLSNLSRVEQTVVPSYPASPAINSHDDGASVAANFAHPAMAMLGEMVYGRIFGNSHTTVYAYPNSYNLAAGNNNPRIRRHMMESDKSLSRLTFFLFCCMLLCLLFF